MCPHTFHGAQAAGTAPVHFQEEKPDPDGAARGHRPAAGPREAARDAPERDPAPPPGNQVNNRVDPGGRGASCRPEKTIEKRGRKAETTLPADEVLVMLSGKTHQQMQRWVGKALSRSKMLAEPEGVSP